MTARHLPLLCALAAGALPCLAQHPGAGPALRMPLSAQAPPDDGHPQPRAPQAPWADPAQTAPQARLALEFRSSGGNGPSPRGLFKVQLSADSVLHVRPRGGGLAVTYRSQF